MKVLLSHAATQAIRETKNTRSAIYILNVEISGTVTRVLLIRSSRESLPSFVATVSLYNSKKHVWMNTNSSFFFLSECGFYYTIRGFKFAFEI